MKSVAVFRVDDLHVEVERSIRLVAVYHEDEAEKVIREMKLYGDCTEEELRTRGTKFYVRM